MDDAKLLDIANLRITELETAVVSWKEWHIDLANALGLEMVERSLTLRGVARLIKADKRIAELERQVEGCDDCAGMSEEDMQEQLTRSQRENMERIAELEGEVEALREKLATAVGGSAWFKTLREEITRDVSVEYDGLRMRIDNLERSLAGMSGLREIR